MASARRRVNIIERLGDVDGRIVEAQGELNRVVLHYFFELF